MADDADRAQLEIEAEITYARLAAQAGSKLTPTGHCHNCEEQLDRAEQLFCNQACGQDFEKRERALSMRGD